MADDKKKRNEAGRDRVNLNKNNEVLYWCKELYLSPEELQHLAPCYGFSIEKIRAALGR
jgi:hypothetical protein